MNLGLLSRSIFDQDAEVKRKARRSRGCWLKSRALFRLVLLTASFWRVQGQGAADPYTAESEKSPPPVDEISRDWMQKRNREAQERFRKKVALSSSVSAEIGPPSSESSGRLQTGRDLQTLPAVPLGRENLLIFAVCV